MAAAVIFSAVSCAKEDISSSIGGGEVEVTFTANLADMGTRAYGEANNVDVVYLGIYDQNGLYLDELTNDDGYPVDKVRHTASIPVVLLKDKTYDLVFWAQHKAQEGEVSCYTMNWTARKMTVTYDSISQDDERDAFFLVDNGFLAGEEKNPEFRLYRPFAQLNAGLSADEVTKIGKNGVDVSKIKSEVVVKNVANVLNLKHEADENVATDVEGEVDAVFTIAAKPEEALKVSDFDYEYLSMNYLLVDTKRNVDVEYTFTDADNTRYARNYYNVPLQRNYRTNIVGNLLSSEYEFNVIIVPGFNEPANNYVTTIKDLQLILDNAKANEVTKVILGADMKGDVTVVQKPDTKIVIDGNGHKYNGVITVDGKSAAYDTADLTIKNVNFVGEAISADACIRLGNGDNSTRYTNKVTVDSCTFDAVGAVGVKSYTGGDKNLTIVNSTATKRAHSLIQAKGIDGILVEGCKVHSKNGLNFNNSTNVTVQYCEVAVKGYAVRYGESSGGVGAAEKYWIKNSSLKSDCEDGDAVIILRGTADYATLNIENTTLDGAIQIANTAKDAKVIIDGNSVITTVEEIDAAIKAGNTEVVLVGYFDKIVAESGITYKGNNAVVGCINLYGADNVTIKNINFDVTNAKVGYDGSGNAKQPASIITGDNVNKPTKGAHNLVIDGCTFTGTFTDGGGAIAFTDQHRVGSGNITIKNCTFDTKGGYFDIYTYYSGNNGYFIIENNIFKTVHNINYNMYPIYLGKYQSSVPVVVKGNKFEAATSLATAFYLQDHGSYGVSVDASDNTFAL